VSSLPLDGTRGGEQHDTPTAAMCHTRGDGASGLAFGWPQATPAESLGSSADRSLRNSCPTLAILRPAAMRGIAKELPGPNVAQFPST
jgi:hypothetical protein